MSATLYLTRNGLLEPLGQSQVFSYLRGLSQDHSITLITFEKPEDRADSHRMALAQAQCAAHGIRWLPQQFRARPKLIAPALSLLRMTWLSWRMARRGEADLIHSRSYIPAAVGWLVWRLTGVPFIFDMRALWPEEMITAGRLRRDSLLHRVLQRLERVCLRDAAAVVSLTEAAVAHLRATYPDELGGQRICVIPTCADLDRFTPATASADAEVHGCVGTVTSGWFRIDWLAAYVRAVARADDNARFEVVTRDDPETVRAQIDPCGTLGNLSIFACAPQDMPDAVRRQSVSVMFFTDGLGKLGSSPTRMGEILGCGIPVVANSGVGDVAGIVARYRVGVLVEDASDATMDRAVEELARLRADPELPARCRQAAAEVFSLERGTDAYRALYAEILEEKLRECAD
ncbi:MAG: glycosyltransferase family 4 protein [Natronohydrobacter sp.]|nr:glycosyltransferase family 4 protein [Natronohydrobacter sp.]